MALRPERQRTSATPIIAKGLLYPLQNPRASKLATHSFTSKSALHHMMNGQKRCDHENKRKTEISRDFSAFFDFEVFRIWIDAFRAFRVCSRIRAGEMHFWI